MAIFDLILIGIVAVFVLIGLWLGAIQSLGALVGTFAGAYCAGLWYNSLGAWLESFWGHPNLMRIFAFIFLFILINRLVGFVFYLIDKIFHLLSIIPFLKTINRLLGAVLGFIEGVLIVGLSLFIIARFPLSPWFTGILQTSKVAPLLLKITAFLQVFLPEILKALKSVI